MYGVALIFDSTYNLIKKYISDKIFNVFHYFNTINPKIENVFQSKLKDGVLFCLPFLYKKLHDHIDA